MGRNDVFFHEQLDAVGNGLQPAEFAPHSRRTEPVLDAARYFALQPNEKDRRRGYKSDQNDRSNDGQCVRILHKGHDTIKHGASSSAATASTHWK